MNEITILDKSEQILKLTPEQQLAVPMVISGMSDREIAETVGVGRTALWKWKTTNPAFIAAVNSARRELWDSASNRLVALLDKAVSVVEKAIDNGDAKSAFALLKLININPEPPSKLKTDEEEIITGIILKHTERYLARNIAKELWSNAVEDCQPGKEE